jgi:8-oxo-dGTP pyrophosphatase MutT (NUDIX family)
VSERRADRRLPEWLAPLREAARTIRGRDLSGYEPPDHPPPREGAVLILFGDGPDGPDLLLTERAHHMRSQPGHVSFPGGSLDPGESPVDAALREAHEEAGLDPDWVTVFAVLPRLWLPPRNFAVAPVLAYWADDAPLRPNPEEVHAAYRVPVGALADPERRFTVRHPMGWDGPGWMIGPADDVLLWGFTAGIVDALLEHVGWARPWDRTRVRRLPERMVDWKRLAASLGIEVPEGEFDPVAAGLVPADYFDVDREHRPREGLETPPPAAPHRGPGDPA